MPACGRRCDGRAASLRLQAGGPGDRRHRRARVPGRGAGRRARDARRGVRAGHRQPWPAVAGRPGAPADPLHPFGEPERLAPAAAHGRCCRSGLAWSMPGGRSGASIRRWWSASAAMPRCRPCSPPACAGCRPCCTSRTPCWARPIAWCWAAWPASARPSPRPAACENDQRARLVGNPVREPVRTLRALALSRADADRVVDVLVFGGSQGAASFSQVMPAAVLSLPRRSARAPAPGAAVPAGGSRSRAQGLSAGRHRRRAGAVLRRPAAAAGRGASGDRPRRRLDRWPSWPPSAGPSILVPYPYAADDHQTANARAFEATGACIVIPHAAFTADGAGRQPA